WDSAAVKNFAVGNARYDLNIDKKPGSMSIKIMEKAGAAGSVKRILLSPALPLDAKVRSVTLNGVSAKFDLQRSGDGQFVGITIENAGANNEAVVIYDEGTDSFVEQEISATGAISQGLRVLHSRAEAGVLKLMLEGRGGHTYELRVRTPNKLAEVNGVK